MRITGLLKLPFILGVLSLCIACANGAEPRKNYNKLKAITYQDAEIICQIIAPLSPGAEDKLSDVVKFVSDIGLTPRISPDIYNISGPEGAPWYSNSDSFRAEDMARGILDPDVKILWMINGGSGAYRTLEILDKLLPPPPLPVPPKLIIGFSAATPIFIYLQNKYNWPSIHGALLDLIVQGYYENSTEISVDPLVNMIFGNAETTLLPKLTKIDNGPALKEPVRAPVSGGSMRQIALSKGTAYKLNATGTILFFEMLESSADSVNDFLDSLLFSGTFYGVVAVVFGDFMADYINPEQIDWIFNRFSNEEPRITFPVFRLTGIGHDRVNHPLPLNTMAELSHVEGTEYSLVVENVKLNKYPEF